MNKLLFFVTIFSILFIAGCTGDVPKLSAISKINADFSLGSPSALNGGVYIIGERQDAPGRVSFAFPDAASVTPVIMERGDWIFYGLGYSGSDSDLRDGKFAGLAECGMSSVNIRGGEQTAISLNLSTDGCSGKLSRNLKLQKIVVDTCPSYTYYNNTNPYVFYPQSGVSAFACTNQPEDQNSNIQYYKLFAVNTGNGVVTDGFNSPCLDEIALGSYLRRVPIKIAPMKIKIYRSLASCNGDNIAHNTFYFPDGLLAGDSANFDSFLAEDFVPGVSSRLYLPESHMKRYHSPFLNNIPRFMCDTPDCFVTPNTDLRTMTVDWRIPKKEQLIIPDINGNYTCDDFSHYSSFFGFSDCKIKNNSLYATVSRNKLACQDVAVPVRTYLDLYERNGFIYVLFESGANTFVSILSDEGVLISSIDLGGNLDYTNVAASNAGDIFVSNPVGGYLRKVKKTGASTWAIDLDIAVTNVDLIEATTDGRFLYYSESGSYRINSIDLETNTTVYSMPTDLPAYVQKLQLVDGKLYAHITADPLTDPTILYRYAAIDGDLEYETNISGGGLNTSFHIANNLYHYLTTAYGVGTQRGYSTAPDALSLQGVNGPTGPFTSPVNDIIVVNNTVYGIQRNGLEVLTLQWVGGLYVAPTLAVNSCTETFSVLMAGLPVATHRIVSKNLPDNIEKALQIFEGANKLVGRNSAGSKTYFNSLSEDQTRNTNGGIISLPQRLLGVHGAGSLLYDFNDCNAVKAAALIQPISRSVGVTDPYRGYQSYTIDVTSNNDLIHKFICDDAAINNAACSNTYDLLISVTNTSMFENERFKIKLHCTSKTGQMDYRRNTATTGWSQQTYWNTTNPISSRAETYKFIKDPAHDILETSQVYSSPTFIRGRVTKKDFYGDFNTALIFDYQRGLTNHYSRKVFMGDVTNVTPTEYPAFRSETNYTGAANFCLPITQTDTSQPNVAGCLFNTVITDRVKPSVPGFDPSLSLSTLENEASFGNVFSTFP